MDVAEPHVRRRGLFSVPHEIEPDSGEHETPEGVVIRVRIARRRIRVRATPSSKRFPASSPKIRPSRATVSRSRRG
jgi:hypothetical protein